MATATAVGTGGASLAIPGAPGLERLGERALARREIGDGAGGYRRAGGHRRTGARVSRFVAYIAHAAPSARHMVLGIIAASYERRDMRFLIFGSGVTSRMRSPRRVTSFVNWPTA
jgi:hypothetical protein